MATTEHATNEQCALIMGWSRPTNWEFTTSLDAVALVEARLAELGLGHAYATYLYQVGQFRHIYQFVTASAQTRCDAAWATWQQYRQDKE